MSPSSSPLHLPRTPGNIDFGQLVVARAWKYDGSAHWVVPGFQLGTDQHGTWLYQPAGALVSRPGRAHLSVCEALCLIPAQGCWVATLYDSANEDFDVYIDVSTDIGWQALPTGGWEVNSIDMDLDVIRSRTRGLFLDDEDEFLEHAETMGYPAALQEQMRATSAELLERVGANDEPFSASYRQHWLDAAQPLRTNTRTTNQQRTYEHGDHPHLSP